jgi:ribonuclease III
LQRALTHRSHSSTHNERLEFLGDAVLNLAVSHLLFVQEPKASEGELSRMRSHLVREESLHALAVQVGFPALLRLSEGEAKGGGAQRASILADALEAVIGAVQLDASYEAAAAVVARLFLPLLQSGPPHADKDPKTVLQEWLQARRHPLPQYRIVATEGKAHAQTFAVECAVAVLTLSSQGQGSSRRAAEQAAATALIAQLQDLP